LASVVRWDMRGPSYRRKPTKETVSGARLDLVCPRSLLFFNKWRFWTASPRGERGLGCFRSRAMAQREMQDPAPKAQTGSSTRPGRSYVLRFISGKYQGGEFPIVPDKQIVVGRSSDLDMVLVEDMVSRKHARIAMQQDQIWIEDLGSTNGTFVNGEKIKRARLKEGDRVLIGTSILKVIAGDATSPAARDEAQVKQNLENVAAARRTSQARTMSGSIEEVPLPDLLQLFGTSKKSGVLVVRTEDDVGKIFMRKGLIYFVLINDLDDVPPLKSMYRLLSWQKGLFDLDPPDEREFPNEINVSVQEVLMEGLRQMDEFNNLRDKLPDLHAKLVLTAPLIPPLRDLKPEEIDVIQLAHNFGHLETIMNKSQASDLDTAQIVLKLVKANYLRTE
jgi:pSer/pThr/pTyr-binding forkhead associated (FHA) protein